MGQEKFVLTDAQGNFKIDLPPEGSSMDLVFAKAGFRTQKLPVDVPKGEDLIMQVWTMFREDNLAEELPTFDLQDLQSMGDDFDRGQIGSVLHAQRNPFLNVAAFQFGSAFFRLRGMDSRNNTVTINGIPMNTFESGRPLWSQWGGLNDFTNRAQQFQFGITATENNFGGILGHTQLDLKPSAFYEGSKISQGFSNTTYQYRSMISEVRSIGKSVRFAALLSYRAGQRGYIEGTPYMAFSGLLSVENKWNNQHNSWITAFFTPNQRGKSAPLTQEVFNLKGRQYNPHWGWQSGKIRNARTAAIALPMVIINHHWKMKSNWELLLSVAHQWGSQSASRLYYNGSKPYGDFLVGGGQNPDPTYYQKLPSYFLRSIGQQNFQAAYGAQKSLLEDGQINWKSLYEGNGNQPTGDATYVLYKDVKAPDRKTATFQLKRHWNSGVKLTLNGAYINEETNFFATPHDLLGSNHVWDLNPYAPDFLSAQNNLNTPERKVGVDSNFLYDYQLNTEAVDFSGQLVYQKRGFDTFLGFKIQSTTYQRIGNFKNGTYPENSEGAGERIPFLGRQIKGGFNYAFTGRLRFFVNGGMYELPPSQKNLYANPRENHWVNPESGIEKNYVWEGGYQYQDNQLDMKLSAFWIRQKDLSEVSFYYADGVGGDHSLFVQEVLSGVQTEKKGVEFYGVYHPVPELKITAVAAVGQYTLDNHPTLLLSSVSDEATIDLGFERGFKNMGKSQMKGYALAGGPQRAFSLGFDYEDPNYWRIGLFGNYFSHTYLDANPLLRTQNFIMDSDGLPFVGYDLTKAKALLEQERFPPYFLLNATGGKSWRLGKKYFGFFIALQNLLNTTYKTGGFEQGRNANYQSLLEDQSRELPLFGPKYWWGRGTTYFASLYLRF